MEPKNKMSWGGSDIHITVNISTDDDTTVRPMTEEEREERRRQVLSSLLSDIKWGILYIVAAILGIFLAL